eukprot:11190291-Lingulodinium_polyedra.AAC.1
MPCARHQARVDGPCVPFRGGIFHPYDHDPFNLIRGFVTQFHKRVDTLGWVRYPRPGWAIIRDT